MSSWKLAGLMMLLGATANAEGKNGDVLPAPKAGTQGLACPAGARQVGGPASFMEATGCVKFSTDGTRVFHGPYIAYWKNGVKQAEGQYLDNFRSGKWVYFDEKGGKTGETSFKQGDYDGARVEFWPSGQKKLEEFYVAGRRQGAQKTWDLAGKVVTVDFENGRPAAK